MPVAEDGYASRAPQGHGYTIFYEHYFEASRFEPLRLLEIGVLDGASLATWKEYFPNAQIYGLDLDPSCSRFTGDRVQVFIGSQADESMLASLRRQVPEGFDIIIDDGSHYVKHIIASFQGLFNHLNSGGLYVIEDIHVACWAEWGSVAFNMGMDLQRETGGNDPEQMVQFLHRIRERPDVTDMAVHLKKICVIRKAVTQDVMDPEVWERGDRLEDLYPQPRNRSLLQKVAIKLLGEF